MSQSAVFESLRNNLPPVFPRSQVGKLTGGLIAAGTCANADYRGVGPEGRSIVNKKTIYVRDAFLAWLEVRMTPGGRVPEGGKS